MDDNFLSCDWGTSNFRLRLVSVPGLAIVAETTSDEGIAKTFKSWQAAGADDEKKKLFFYLDIIGQHITKLQEQLGKSLDNVPVVISGMASSSIGFVNLPYQPLPVSTDGSDISSRLLKQTGDFKHDVLLISGVKSNDDVMRGEETQLIGCITGDMEQYAGEQLFIHPGTHSKHMTVKNKKIIAFKTFMTGEFFKLLSAQSILHENVAANTGFKDNSKNFEQGVLDSVNANLLHAAFKVRTNDLFNLMKKTENYWYLSGLLIGYELQEVRDAKGKIYLCSGANLADQYTAALAALNLSDKVEILPPKWVDESVIRGQYKIYNKLQK